MRATTSAVPASVGSEAEMDMRVENYALGSMSRTAKKATRAIQCAAQQNTRMHWTDLPHDDRAKRLGASRLIPVRHMS